jgi:cyanophycin synthetase
VVPDALELVKKLKEEEEKEAYQFTTEDIPNM